METNLAIIKKEERIRSLAILAENDPREAESALCDLASAEGDQALIKLVTDSSPITIGQIISQHDASSETIVSYLLSPKMIAKMLVMQPAEWEKLTREKIVEIQEIAFHLIVSLLINKPACERRMILEAIKEIDEAFAFLVFSLAELDPKKIPRDEDDALLVQENTPEMLLSWIQEASEEIAEEILKDLHQGTSYLAKILHQEAMAKIAPAEPAEEDFFSPL